MIKDLKREWKFMLRQRYVVMVLLCSFIVASFSIVTGLSEVKTQQQTIDRLKTADEIDRAEAQAKYDDPGSLAYYSFHLTYSEPSNLAFAALGDRDVYPWKHRIKMLALEGQIYESDAQNAELAHAGKIDWVFVISALSPLLLILLFHDLIASERSSGRHDLLVTTAKTLFGLWGGRLIVRFTAIYISLLVPFYIGALLSNTSIGNVLLVSIWTFLYFAFWTALSVYLGRKTNSSPRIASGLIGVWVLLAFVIPILGDLVIKQSVQSPKGGEILLTQREAVNDAWDLPVETTMDAFIERHPEHAGKSTEQEGFDWMWYYAFQQVGDQKAESLSINYRRASEKKYALAGYISFISPPMLFQRLMSRRAETDAIAAFEYESDIRDFHQSLRNFYYPWLFENNSYDKSRLNDLPQFISTKTSK